MTGLKRSLAQRIGGLSIVLVALLLGTSIPMMFTLRAVSEHFDPIARKQVPAMDYTARIEALAREFRIQVLLHGYQPTPEMKNRPEERIRELRGQIEAVSRNHAETALMLWRSVRRPGSTWTWRSVRWS